MPEYFQARETVREDEVDGLLLAHFGQRAVGFCLDLFLVWLLRKPVEWLWQVYVPHGWERHTLVDLVHVRSLIVLVTYFSLALYFGNGQTIGKWLARTRVISLTHERMNLWQSVERALGYGASFLELGFGFMQFFINRNRQCAHDRLAQTIVIDVRGSMEKIVDDAKQPEVAADDLEQEVIRAELIRDDSAHHRT